MTTRKFSRPEFKELILKHLEESDLESVSVALQQFPPKRLINALTPHLLHTDELIRQRAVIFIGQAASRLAEQDIEAARIIIRRYIWNLMEESGNCATGSPEVIGECLANQETLANEFAPMLLSFIMPEGNFLDYDPLMIGALWGIGRLAEVRPELLADAPEYLIPLVKYQNKDVKDAAQTAYDRITRHK